MRIVTDLAGHFHFWDILILRSSLVLEGSPFLVFAFIFEVVIIYVVFLNHQFLSYRKLLCQKLVPQGSGQSISLLYNHILTRFRNILNTKSFSRSLWGWYIGGKKFDHSLISRVYICKSKSQKKPKYWNFFNLFETLLILISK